VKAGGFVKMVALSIAASVLASIIINRVPALRRLVQGS